HPERRQFPVGAMAELVVPQRGEEQATPGEPGELHGGHGAAAPRLLPRIEGVHDLARFGHALDVRELDPFDVPDDRDVHYAPQVRPARRAGARRGGLRRAPRWAIPNGGTTGARRHRRWRRALPAW